MTNPQNGLNVKITVLIHFLPICQVNRQLTPNDALDENNHICHLIKGVRNIYFTKLSVKRREIYRNNSTPLYLRKLILNLFTLFNVSDKLDFWQNWIFRAKIHLISLAQGSLK